LICLPSWKSQNRAHRTIDNPPALLKHTNVKSPLQDAPDEVIRDPECESVHLGSPIVDTLPSWNIYNINADIPFELNHSIRQSPCSAGTLENTSRTWRFLTSFFSASSAVAPLTPTPANPTDDSTDTDMDDPDFDGQSNEEDGPVPDPEKPIFERSIPGILTKEQIFAEVDLDHIKIRVRDTEAETGDLVSWETSDMGSTRSIKGIIAELVAAVGAEAAGDMVVYFS
jgi:hypothetical protein